VSGIALLILAINVDVFAHGGGNWNAFTIDRVNNKAHSQVLQLQQQISNLIRSRSEGTE
jgi:hypothetical protein